MATAAGAPPTIDGEATSPAAEDSWNLLPTHVFVEVLLLLPAMKRWRLRIVCRYWRDVIHDRTPAPERWSRPTALVFFQNYRGRIKVSASAFIFDDLEWAWRGREVWRSEYVPPAILHRHPKSKYKDSISMDAFDTMMVGTCNGLLCLCDNTRPGGAVSLFNPTTGETLALPPLPGSAHWVWWGMLWSSGWHEAYSFAYEPMAEQYKVVHLPCYLDRSGGFNVLQVFVLGKKEAPAAWSWRDVPTPGASCCLDAGVVSVDGVTYWLTKAAERVVAFDVRGERVTSCTALPAQAKRGYVWHLADVQGRLGLVSSSDSWVTPEKIDVWVLAGVGDRRGWSRRYAVQLNDGVKHWIGRPHFAHGDYVLTEDNRRVFKHKRNTGTWSCGEVRSVRIRERTPGVAVSRFYGDERVGGVFAYIRTKEPLSVYKPRAS